MLRYILFIKVAYARKGFESSDYIDSTELAKVFNQSFSGQLFVKGQQLALDFKGTMLVVTISDLACLDVNAAINPKGGNMGSGNFNSRGILTQQTDIQFSRSADSTIKIKGSAKSGPTNAIIQPNFKFEDMGIGGLDSEFSAIFRRAFASRIFPPHLVEKLGIHHVKGILLFGPPGTGKTLMVI